MSEIRIFTPKEAAIYEQGHPEAELVALTEALIRVLTEEKN